MGEKEKEEEGLQIKANDQLQDKAEPPQQPTLLKRLSNIYFTNEFLILIVVVICLARAYPPLGAVYLQPSITATWIAVIYIFFLAGLGLKTEEFSKAFQRLWFNLFVQIFNFGVISSFVYGISRLLVHINIIGKNLADGMVICSCLPITINMVYVLTAASNGDEAAAVFNAAAGNMIGVFLSPILILAYVGVTGSVDMAKVFVKLCLRVVLPILIGQIVQKCIKIVVEFYTKNKKYIKKTQMYSLVFIVYTVFCKTFSDESKNDENVASILLMILFQSLQLCTMMALAWFLLGVLFPKEPKLRVMGLYGCTHKTVAMGIPLINAIFEDSPFLGLYTLPLLVWHPTQLMIGTFLSPRLAKFVDNELIRLDIDNDNDDEVELI